MSDWTYLQNALAEITGAVQRLAGRVAQLESAPVPITWTAEGVDGTAHTVLTAVPNAATLVYALHETVGGATTGGADTLALGQTLTLYNAGGDIFTAALSAGGTLTVQRALGASTYDVSLIILPI